MILRHQISNPTRSSLSVISSVACILDIFGVFPLIALSKPILECGVYGIFVVIIVCALQIYTAILLGRCWLLAEKIDEYINHKNRYPYSALAEFTFGRRMGTLTTILVDVSVFASAIPNLIVASQILHMLNVRLISNDNYQISSCAWLLIVAVMLCPMLFFGSPKDMSCLYYTSFAIIVIVFVLLCVTIADVPENKLVFDTKTIDANTWQSIVNAYGILTFQFDIHPTLLTIQMDMDNKKQIGVAVRCAFAGSLSMFAILTLLAKWKVGYLPHTSLLQSLSPSMLLNVSAFFVAVQLIITCAVSNSALYQHLEGVLHIARSFNARRCVLRIFLTLFAVILSEIFPRFDLVMSIVGGTLTAPLVFIFPPIIYIRLKKLYNIKFSTGTHLGYGAMQCSEGDSIHNTKTPITYERTKRCTLDVMIGGLPLIGVIGLLLSVTSTCFNIAETWSAFTNSSLCILNLIY